MIVVSASGVTTRALSCPVYGPHLIINVVCFICGHQKEGRTGEVFLQCCRFYNFVTRGPGKIDQQTRAQDNMESERLSDRVIWCIDGH